MRTDEPAVATILYWLLGQFEELAHGDVGVKRRVISNRLIHATTVYLGWNSRYSAVNGLPGLTSGFLRDDFRDGWESNRSCWRGHSLRVQGKWKWPVEGPPRFSRGGPTSGAIGILAVHSS